MLAIVITITTLGLFACMAIAIYPDQIGHYIQKSVDAVQNCWAEAMWYEKIGLALLVLPIPGPVDEIIGLLVIRRIVARRRNIRAQIAEDTCSEHDTFCCAECFNMEPVGLA